MNVLYFICDCNWRFDVYTKLGRVRGRRGQEAQYKRLLPLVELNMRLEYEGLCY